MVEEIIEMKTKYYETDKYEDYQKDLLSKVGFYKEMGQDEKSNEIIDFVITNTPSETDSDIFTITDAIMLKSYSKQMDGKNDEVLDLFKKSQKLLETVDGGARTEHMAVSYSAMADFYYKSGSIQEAATSLEQCCRIYDYILENESEPEIQKDIMSRQASAFEQLGNFHSDLRNRDEALKFLEVALKNWEFIDGDSAEKNPYHIRIKNSVGVCYATFGEYQKGLEFQIEALKLSQPLRPHLIDNYVWILLSLSRTLHQMYMFKESKEYIEEAEEKCKKYNGSPHSLCQIFEQKCNIILTQTSSENNQKQNKQEQIYQEAFEVCEETIKFMIQKNMVREPLYSRMHFQKGLILSFKKKYQEAIQTAQIGYDLAREVFGSKDEQCGDALRVIGISKIKFGLQQQEQEQKEEEEDQNNEKQQQIIQEGFEQLKEALVIFENCPVRLQDQEVVLMELVSLYDQNQNFKQAIIYAERLRNVQSQVLLSLEASEDQITAAQKECDVLIKNLYKKLEEQQ